MARDYKNVTEAGLKAKQSSRAAKSKPSKKSNQQAKQKPNGNNATDDSSIPGWMWLVSGVVIGGFVSFIVYLKLNVPLEDIAQQIKTEQAEVVPKVVKDKSQKPVNSTEVESLNSKQNQFEFYEKLPNQRVFLPENNEAENNKTMNPMSREIPSEVSRELSNKVPIPNAVSGEQGKDNLNTRPQFNPNNKPETHSKIRQYAYTLQVGSFLNFKDADKRKANLAMLGVGSRIHAIKMSGKTRYRVMVGPYENIKRVNDINAEMKANNIKTLLLKERI